ncbi:Protein of unknown function DUF58 [Desulfatibacillum alkenivorans DSM 16219]|jgi:uncharacterized protein (DUF58 family)|uniref:DUF58 domain-containing protein n=1 Tax=Desulfatibacillum alkenivorans DSM 16219 TaxID=1121393 RepID=A0A1M6K0X6_9BACT|nr:DUF58 domain-containing protein [Desulfatibacillum alkenivorans]SHJ52609.1 Protein of unknown function DUF58 [Desulfatibacillum alkenivorans DSM 16219]
MLPKELIGKIQKFHFRTRFLANDLFAGQYVSAFKGKGMEFAEVREYVPGDDVRDIDWNVTARMGHPYVKVFSEERELTVLLLLDLSASNLFGTSKRFKRELAAEVAGLLAFTAVRTNDKVGAILFSDKVERFIPPKKGAGHVWGLIRDIFSHEPQSAATNLSAPLDHLNKLVRRHAVVFLISDFMVPEFDHKTQTSMYLASRKHDLTAIRIQDPAERILPNVGLVWMRDPETGQALAVDTSNKGVRRRWEEDVARRDAELKTLLTKSGVDRVELSTGGSVVQPLTEYFRRREARK